MNGNTFLASQPAGSMTRVTQCAVVMYHYVRPVDDMTNGVKGLTPNSLRAQIERLCAWGEPVTWPRFRDWYFGYGSIPQKSFLLTFDDGLKDHAIHAAPVLNSMGLSGLFFVPTSILESPSVLSAHKLHMIMGECAPGDILARLESFFDAEASSQDCFSDNSELREKAQRVYHYEPPQTALLKFVLHQVCTPEQRERFLKCVFDSIVCDEEKAHAQWYLGADDVRTLAANGHEMGGHSHRHNPLATLSLSAAKADLQSCRNVLKRTLGRVENAPLAYPFGSFDQAVKQAAQRAGFSLGFTTEKRFSSLESSCFEIPRVDTIHVDELIRSDTP